jgi:hypothetical protein
VGSVGHVMHSGASEARKVDALFFMLSGTGVDLIKSALGHITLNLCFCIRWDLWVTCCISVRLRRETSMHYFSC